SPDHPCESSRPPSGEAPCTFHLSVAGIVPKQTANQPKTTTPATKPGRTEPAPYQHASLKYILTQGNSDTYYKCIAQRYFGQQAAWVRRQTPAAPQTGNKAGDLV